MRADVVLLTTTSEWSAMIIRITPSFANHGFPCSLRRICVGWVLVVAVSIPIAIARCDVSRHLRSICASVFCRIVLTDLLYLYTTLHYGLNLAPIFEIICIRI